MVDAVTVPFLKVPRPTLRDFRLSVFGKRKTPFVSGNLESFEKGLEVRFRVSLWRGKRGQGTGAVHLEDVALSEEAAKRGTPDVLVHPSFGNSFTWEVPAELLQPGAEEEVFAVLTCLSIPPDAPLRTVVHYDPLELAAFKQGVRTAALEQS